MSLLMSFGGQQQQQASSFASSKYQRDLIMIIRSIASCCCCWQCRRLQQQRQRQRQQQRGNSCCLLAGRMYTCIFYCGKGPPSTDVAAVHILRWRSKNCVRIYMYHLIHTLGGKSSGNASRTPSLMPALSSCILTFLCSESATHARLLGGCVSIRQRH